jgi:polyisoprenoid-binding protein YceI
MINSTVTQPAAIMAPAPGSYRIDAVRSAITFTTRHLFGLGAVRGSFELRDREIHVTAPLSGCLARARSLPRASTPAIPAEIARSARLLDAATYPDIDIDPAKARRRSGAQREWAPRSAMRVTRVSEGAMTR